METSIVQGIGLAQLEPTEVVREFRALVRQGAKLRIAGLAREEPQRLVSARYVPHFRLELFGLTIYLTGYRFDEDLNFLVGYLVPPGKARTVIPRIFYKDSSLVWRVVTHFIDEEGENWVGKGDLKPLDPGDPESFASAEETTNLPLEIQGALDDASRLGGKASRDMQALGLFVRRAPLDRVEPYADFSTPRELAMESYRVNRGRPIARFRRKLDPESLVFVPGFEPDFRRGLVEVTHSRSRIYGGEVAKYRVLSTNGIVQHAFVACPSHVWMNPPQSLTTELSTYGVRTVDVEMPEDAFLPGYEYHYIDDSVDPPELYSQIPEGFAGPASEVDSSRADGSAWIEAMPVIQAFRRAVL